MKGTNQNRGLHLLLLSKFLIKTLADFFKALKSNGQCQCADGWTGTLCNECAANHGGSECTPCPECGPHQQCSETVNGTGQCECRSGFTGDGCTECADERFAGENCDQCANTLFSLPDCISCSDARFTGPHCDECVDGATDQMFDKSGRAYKTVCLNKQFWMAENMQYITDKYYHAGNMSMNDADYGLLYSWPTAQNICPAGWYIPSDREYLDLFDYIKNTGKTLSVSSPEQCNDEFGLCFMPAGLYQASLSTYAGFESSAYLWTSTETECSENDKNCAHSIMVNHTGAQETPKEIYTYQSAGESVRCAQSKCSSERFTGAACDECLDGVTDVMVDKAGNSYRTVCIDKRFWMAQNMKYTADGIDCYKNTDADADFVNKYGCLYNWEGANKICPEGWTLPSKDDYNHLLNYIDAASWPRSGSLRDPSFANGTNETAFSALGASYYSSTTNSYGKLSNVTYFWTSSKVEPKNGSGSYSLVLYPGDGAYVSGFSENSGFAVRCIEDFYCENENMTGRHCDQCKNTLKSYASGCTACKNALMIGDKCDECGNGGFGSKCTTYNTVKALQGDVYKTVVINNKEWLAENMRYESSQATCHADYAQNSAVRWHTVDIGCSAESECKAKYGCLYTWQDAQNVCDSLGTEWRLPGKADFEDLITFASEQYHSDEFFAAFDVMAAKSDLWMSPGSNESGFGALPLGRYYVTSTGGSGYSSLSESGTWWSADRDQTREAYAYALNLSPYRSPDVSSSYSIQDGYSIRCVRDVVK